MRAELVVDELSIEVAINQSRYGFCFRYHNVLEVGRQLDHCLEWIPLYGIACVAH